MDFEEEKNPGSKSGTGFSRSEIKYSTATTKARIKDQQKRISNLLENKSQIGTGMKPPNIQKFLRVSIPSFYTKNNSHYFRIEIKKKVYKKSTGDMNSSASEKTAKQIFNVDKTFNEFHDLLKELKDEKYVYVPSLPSKTLIPKTSDSALEKRKGELQDFLQALL